MKQGSGSTALGVNAQANANNAVALGKDSVANRDNTVSVGAAGKERQITNVAQGEKPTDAVNVQQFQKGLEDTLAKADQNARDLFNSRVRNSMDDLEKKAFSGIAMAMAMAMLPDVEKDKSVALGASAAGFRGRAGIATGAAIRFNEHLRAKLGLSFGQSSASFGAGVAAQW